MTDNNEKRFLIDIPADGNYIEILGHRIDGFESFEAFCEHLKKYAELEETVKSQKAEIEALKEAKEKAQATAAGVIKRQDAEIKKLRDSRDRWRQIAEAFDKATRENEEAVEEIAQPYLLINIDAELTAEMKEAIKKQPPVFVPGNEATVEFLDKASIRAEAFSEFAEKFLKKVHDNHYLLSDRINSRDYGIFTIGIEQAVNETKEEMAGRSEDNAG